MVGSKLINSKGQLVEAGRAISSTGQVIPCGRGFDAMAPEFNYLCDVDACSSAALLTRRTDFLSVGGFKENSQNILLAEADLALKMRLHGSRVLYQPCAEALLRSPAEDIGLPAALKEGNEMKSNPRPESRRHVPLERYGLGSHLPGTGADDCPGSRILIVDACTPTPDQDSGSLDMLNYMTILVDLGYQVTFLPETDLQHAGRYTRDLQAMGVECLYYPYVRSLKWLLDTRGRTFNIVMLVRAEVAFRWIDRVRGYCPDAKVIFNTVDLHFLRLSRRSGIDRTSSSEKAALRAKKRELGVIEKADATIVVSTVERDLLAVEAPNARVQVVPILREIPGRERGYEARNGVVFIGGFRHPPNVDALLWFCAEVWPLVQQTLPRVTLSIVGSNLVPEIAALDGEGIRVLGFVEDIGPIFSKARLSIAPLRYGAGQKGKVVTSLGYGVPCVATSVAGEGLGLGNGEGIMVADQSAPFAQAVVSLHEDSKVWEELSTAGLARVQRSFSVEVNRSRLAYLMRYLQSV
jgi:glycosyltransferase involved in cell wall biosynthesis